MQRGCIFAFIKFISRGAFMLQQEPLCGAMLKQNFMGHSDLIFAKLRYPNNSEVKFFPHESWIFVLITKLGCCKFKSVISNKSDLVNKSGSSRRNHVSQRKGIFLSIGQIAPKMAAIYRIILAKCIQS
jgi:hypothetical protein